MSNFNIKDYLDGGIQTYTRMYYSEEFKQTLITAARILGDAFSAGNRLYICGNGGSAADAQHLAAEFISMGLPAHAVSTNTSVITALSNDVEFAKVFSYQIQALGSDGDVLLGITTSGKSLNVRYAIAQANMMHMTTIALTGKNGLIGTVKPTITINVPSEDTQHIQEAHIAVYHMLWLMVKEMFNG